MSVSLESFLAEILGKIKSVKKLTDLEQLKAAAMGRKGSFNVYLEQLKAAPQKQKRELGQLLNKARGKLDAAFKDAFEAAKASEQAAELGESVDVSAPLHGVQLGRSHPLSQMVRRLQNILTPLGFEVVDGPEIETEWYCFDALNTPEDHPARDAQDTLFFPSGAKVAGVAPRHKERHVLRTHTSCVQIRELLKRPPPLSVMACGRVFRRDTSDATHSANFHQLEGLCIREAASLSDLRGLLEHVIATLLGKAVQTRLRPSYFPFTEPSFEMDIKSDALGKLSGQWIEVLGCGMVDVAVLEAVGLDATSYQGYAFGMGIERLAMLLWGIDDIRHFYNNDLRFLEQFAS